MLARGLPVFALGLMVYIVFTLKGCCFKWYVLEHLEGMFIKTIVLCYIVVDFIRHLLFSEWALIANGKTVALLT